MEPEDFLVLLKNSKCIVGNSSVGIRECSYLGIPSVNIGSRQAGRERGENVVDVDYCTNEISNAILYQIKHGHYDHDPIYGTGNAGKNIANILAISEITSNKKLAY